MHRVSARALIAAAICCLLLATGCGGHPPKPTPTPTPTVTAMSTATPAPPTGELNTEDPAELRDAGNQGVPQAKIDAGEQAAEETAQRLSLPAPTDPIPQGGVQLNPCVVGHYATNRNAYGSVHPNSVLGTVIHETIGPNVLGWGDVYGTANYLNKIGLSANDIIDAEGHCLHFVPYQYDAYAEGNFNRYYDSIEIVGTGQETRAWWLAQPLFKDHILANYLRDRLNARGVPIRLVDPNACTPIAGFTDHNRLECGNDHTDMVGGDPTDAKLDPGFPMDVLVNQLQDKLVLPITAANRTACERVHAYRQRRTARRPGTTEGKAALERRRAALKSHGLRCQAGKVRRR